MSDPVVIANDDDDDDDDDKPSSKDLVIRDGFPALRNEEGEPLIEGEDPIPKALFASYSSALTIGSAAKSLLEDCAKVFSARTKDASAAYSAGCTYFCPALMPPRCALEALALHIFHEHTKHLPPKSFDPQLSGAEWWTLVLDANQSSNADDEEEDDQDEVGMHFDADYGLEDQAPGLLLHPRVATVTYLSNVGAPTLVLNQKSPAPGEIIEARDIEQGWLSGPRMGKHIAFDGRLLHGAPATFFPGLALQDDVKQPAAKKQKTEQQQESIVPPNQRITFLVNVWLNHCPLDAEPLDDEIVEQLTPDTEMQGLKLSLDQPPDELESRILNVSEADPAGEEETVICNRVVTLFYNETMPNQHAISHKVAKNGDSSVELAFAKGSLRIQDGGPVQEGDNNDEAHDGSS
jgi:hypothetical protein